MSSSIVNTAEAPAAARFARPAPAGFGLIKLALAAALCSPMAACSTLEGFNPFGGEKYETKLLPEEPADQIYDQGLARLSKGDAEGAAKKFTDLDKQHPFTAASRKGMIMTTFAHYQGGNYDEAITSAQRYVNLYPTSPDAPYAMYLAAMSQYNQVPDISRDQERAEKALVMFNQLIEKYPKSEYIDDSKYKIQVMRDQLGGKEMSVGRYYLGKRNYHAAVNRFRDVVGRYQTTRHVEEALYRLTESYMALGITHEAQTAAAILGHNFPESPWYQDAYKLLANGGLSPNETQGSWLSRLFKRTG